jgi:hypothetical protein
MLALLLVLATDPAATAWSTRTATDQGAVDGAHGVVGGGARAVGGLVEGQQDEVGLPGVGQGAHVVVHAP